MPLLAGNTYTVSDAVGNNSVAFHSTAPMEDIHGTAEGLTGSVVFDPAAPEKTTGKLSVPVAQMKTGLAKRDKHMYDKEWLDAASFPSIVVEVKSLKNVKKSGSGPSVTFQATAVAAITVHGVTKAVEIPVSITWIKESEKTRQRAPGDLLSVKASFAVVLKDHDIKGAKGIVGSKVGEKIDIEATVFAASN